MKKPMLIGLIAAIASLGLLFAAIRSAQDQETKGESAVKNLTLTIDGQTFALSDGVAEKESAPGSAAKNTVRIVGDPVAGDVNGDGQADEALLIRNDPGGSGAFYYAVVAFADGGAYHATNAVLLGDRIEPQGIEFTGGRFVYRFLERRPGQPMADAPTVKKSVAIQFAPATGGITAGP
ncbi:MAG: hypothetical protein KDB56_08575 [Mycobacterium sp.]|nr:hypothetical protein [Mycobacterium sp.]